MAFNKTVKLFRELASIASIKSGYVREKSGENNFVCTTTWSQQDLTTNQVSHFSRSYVVLNQEILKLHPVELNNEQWNVTSKTGKLTVVIRKTKDKKSHEPKQCLEVWSKEAKILNLEVQCLDQHGEICDDDNVFGCVKWSPLDMKLLYVAEDKQVKTRSYFKQGPNSDAEVEGDSYLYKESWGEQMTEKLRPVLCVLDVHSSLTTVVDWLPSDFSYGQAIWGADDGEIYLIGWYNDPYRLGIIYCPIRKNVLMRVDLKKKIYEQIGPKDRAISSPLLSPMGDKMVYLDAGCHGPHMQCNRLILHNLRDGQWKVVVDIVTSSVIGSFPGLHCSSPHNKFWSKDNKRIVLASHWRSKIELVIINTEDSSVNKLTDDQDFGSWKILDMDNDDMILASRSSINKSDQLLIGKLPGIGKEGTIRWRVISDSQFEGKMTWSVVPMKVPLHLVNKDFADVDYEYILVEPPHELNDRPPMLVFNHGGPHSVVSAGFSRLIAGYCLTGMKILLVNYRGSYGFGQSSINSLLGNIGSQDVLDVKHAIDQLISEGKADEKKLSVTGGSHGGFLTCHLIGQFPELFRVAVVRNPVCNLMTLLGTSDIPDWTYTEIGLKFEPNIPLNEAICSLLYSKSPIAHVSKVKTPTMFLLGAKDRRVPPSQGLQFYEVLKSQSVPTRTLVYPDSNHPLSEVEAESDSFVNSVNWINSFLKE